MLTVSAPPGRSFHSRVEVEPYEYRLETATEARVRYRTIARAITVASRGSRTMARILVSIAENESSLRRDIHSCAKLGDKGASYGPFQMKMGVDSKRGRALCGVGYPATLRAARAAAAHVGRWRGQLCGGEATCLNAFIRYSGLPRSVAETHPGILARGKTFARTAAPRRLPAWATIAE